MRRFLRGRADFVTKVSLALFLALIASGAIPSGARAQEGGVVVEATRLYDQSRFDDAIKLINDAIRAGRLAGDELQGAREILARSYVKKGQRQEGKEAFKAILRSDAGYRPDPVRTPPDEMEVFNMALKERERELIEMGQRIPTSLSGHLGYGSYGLSEFNDSPFTDEVDEIKGGFEFGGAVRVPIRSRFSLDVELGQFKGTKKDDSGNEWQAIGMPLSLGTSWNFYTRPKIRASALVALGALLNGGTRVQIAGSGGTAIAISFTQTGFYSHAGLEGEYLLIPRLALTGRALGRFVRVNNIDTFSGPIDFDFSGLAFHAGLRAYVGY